MKISEIRNLCFEYELKDREILSLFSDDELEQFYNGAGPDSWKPEYRNKLTTAMSLFEPVVLIHDTQFFMSDGSTEGFKHTVDVWKENCKIMCCIIPDTQYLVRHISFAAFHYLNLSYAALPLQQITHPSCS